MNVCFNIFCQFNKITIKLNYKIKFCIIIHALFSKEIENYYFKA